MSLDMIDEWITMNSDYMEDACPNYMDFDDTIYDEMVYNEILIETIINQGKKECLS